ncbi:MAG: glycosyltransferase family 4 protein [Patescibacteria group bacterium]|nr:glycosyltransferase family 4 protein [Patescibacteria group bacterium]
MPKIGIDGRYAEGRLTGIGKYIKGLVGELAGQGLIVVIFYSKKPLENINGKNIIPIILQTRNRYVFEQILLPLALKREKVNLFHEPGNLGIPFFCPCPSVLTVHDIIPLLVNDYFKKSPWQRLSKASYSLRLLISLLKAKQILTDSKFTQNSLMRKFSFVKNKTTVISPGIFCSKEERNWLPMGIKPGNFILNQGGIDKRKNLLKLINAFALIKHEFPKLKLVITGENPSLETELKKASRDLKIEKKVLFTGYLAEDKLWSLVKKAACICLPSEIEGFGMPVLEGFVAKVPVITSNNSSLEEISKGAAFLIDPAKVENIAQGLKKILGSKRLREELIKKGFDRAAKFSWPQTSKKILEIYEKIWLEENES